MSSEGYQTFICQSPGTISNMKLVKSSCLEEHWRTIGLVPHVFQLHMESQSYAKCDYLSGVLKENNTDIVTVQDTHAADYQQAER